MERHPERTIHKSELECLLAPSLGKEKSAEVVASTARSLELTGNFYGPDEVREIFRRVRLQDGLVGVAARFVVSRGDVEALASRVNANLAAPSAREPASPPTTPTMARPRPAAAKSVTTGEISTLLSPALGEEKSREAVVAAARRLGFEPDALVPQEALRILEDLASHEGIVGIVARFAKARFALMHANAV